jgi:hypothetical protein
MRTGSDENLPHGGSLEWDLSIWSDTEGAVPKSKPVGSLNVLLDDETPFTLFSETLVFHDGSRNRHDT